MHYKVASLMLNTGRHLNGCREVYISQPDAVKEDLAGRIFILAEIDGKKADLKRVVDFIITSLEDFYYNDEKIYLLDKIEGLSLDNVFEAALAKLNRALLEFLADEKIFLRQEETNLIIGLLFENRLMFSNFGLNKTFLIFKKQDDYELINVEASAAEEETANDAISAGPKFFSSVITGKIPPASFFLFCNEALPEYISNKDLIDYVAKLPPLVAAEQIKSALGKVNSYVPFLGIIVKNTYGLSPAELKDDALAESTQSAHNSISHLNYTEKRTEQMLAPAGLVNWRKVGKFFGKSKGKGKFAPVTSSLRLKETASALASLPPLSRQKTVSAARLIKQMNFSRGVSPRTSLLRLISGTASLFSPHFWRQSYSRGRIWLKDLNPKNRSLLIILGSVLIILSGSIAYGAVTNGRKASEQAFSDAVSSIEEKKGMIDLYLAAKNPESAKPLIGDSLALLDSLEAKKEVQIETVARLRSEVEALRSRVWKLTDVSPELLGGFKSVNQGAEVRNLLVAEGKAYAADPNGKAVYVLKQDDKSISSLLINGDIKELAHPILEAGAIYYADSNRLLRLDRSNGTSELRPISGMDAGSSPAAIQFYNDYLYLLMADAGKIYRFSASNSGFGSRYDWIRDDTQLTDAVSMIIDSKIFVLKADGKVIRFSRGLKEDFALESIEPALSSASLMKDAGDKLAILDKASHRLIFFNKSDGKLAWQYRFPNLGDVKDFALSEDYKTAFILDGDSVYRFSVQ
ncbi:MAG: cell division protein ZapB [Bacillota bacterium]